MKSFKALIANKLFTAILPITVLVACGQVSQPGSNRRITSDAYGLNTGSKNGAFPVPPAVIPPDTISSDFICPADPNVKPYVDLTNGNLDDYLYQSELGQPGVFQVCTSSKDSKLLDIAGTTYSDSSIHLIPLKRGANGGYYTLPGTQPLQPLVFAAARNPEGKFRILTTSTDFQMVLIVDSNASNALISCIISKNSNNCPRYSAGKIR